MSKRKDELGFDFDTGAVLFEKADAEPGKTRRIAGIITTENVDQQQEVILTKGLDLDPWIAHGWYNDNHSKKTTDILGYPESYQVFQKGDSLPNGDLAPANGIWAEGYLLDTPKANEIWDLGKALAQTGRRLGFSVEGSIQKREGKLSKTVARAVVRNVAITNCPVNTDSKLEVLAKSLQAVEDSDPDDVEKALAMGPANPGAAPEGGAVLATESLESDPKEMKRRKKEAEKSEKKLLTKAEAVSFVRERTGFSDAACERVVKLTKVLKNQGQL
jgi:hypothetical protein